MPRAWQITGPLRAQHTGTRPPAMISPCPGPASSSTSTGRSSTPRNPSTGRGRSSGPITGIELALADWQANIGTEDVFDPLAELEDRIGRSMDGEARTAAGGGGTRSRPGIGPVPGSCAGCPRRRIGRARGHGFVLPPGVGRGHSGPARAAGILLLPGVPRRPGPGQAGAHLVPMACGQLGSDPRRSVAVEDSPTA